jgi:hypothetical protein
MIRQNLRLIGDETRTICKGEKLHDLDKELGCSLIYSN